jgi:hypothetical protein
MAQLRTEAGEEVIPAILCENSEVSIGAFRATDRIEMHSRIRKADGYEYVWCGADDAEGTTLDYRDGKYVLD